MKNVSTIKYAPFHYEQIKKMYNTFLFYLIDSTRRKESTAETALFILFYVLLVSLWFVKCSNSLCFST